MEDVLVFSDIELPRSPEISPGELHSPFSSVIGSYAHGCATEISDIDIHMVYCAPLGNIIGLKSVPGAIAYKTLYHSKTLEVTGHEAKEFVKLLFKGNPNALDTLYSPYHVRTSPAHETLKIIAKGCITKLSAQAYANMAHNQIKIILDAYPNEVKPLLHLCRSALTAIHLLRNQTIELHLPTLAKLYEKEYVLELIDFKKAGMSAIPYTQSRFEAAKKRQDIIDDLGITIGKELEASILPEKPTEETENALHEWLGNLRLAYSDLL